MGGVQAAMLHHRRTDPLIFTRPFSGRIWLAIIVIYFIYGITLFVISQLSKRMGDAFGQQKEDFSLLEAFKLFSVTSLQFGPEQQTRSHSGRVLQDF